MDTRVILPPHIKTGNIVYFVLNNFVIKGVITKIDINFKETFISDDISATGILEGKITINRKVDILIENIYPDEESAKAKINLNIQSLDELLDNDYDY